jgi:Helix-turn-helix of insertion element transposase
MYRRMPDREKVQARAAILAAEDELSDTEIARLCGITRRTLIRWKKQPSVRQKKDEHLRLIQLHAEVEMISERQKRVSYLDIRHQELQSIIRVRSSSPEMRDVPGGRSGLMRRRKRYLSQRCRVCLGADYEYEVDIPLLRELRQLEMAAAKALGQWQVPNYRPIAVPTSLVVPSGKQHRAALLIADNTRSDLEIATICGINRRTLARWKQEPSFRTRVAELRTTVFS